MVVGNLEGRRMLRTWTKDKICGDVEGTKNDMMVQYEWNDQYGNIVTSYLEVCT